MQNEKTWPKSSVTYSKNLKTTLRNVRSLNIVMRWHHLFACRFLGVRIARGVSLKMKTGEKKRGVETPGGNNNFTRRSDLLKDLMGDVGTKVSINLSAC